MRRIALATFPLITLLLASCSWNASPSKSDLQMASQAAKIAGDDDVLARTAPLDLVAASTRTKSTIATRPKIAISVPVPAEAPMVAMPAMSTGSVTKPAITETAATLAMSQPIAAGPAPATNTPIATVDIDTTVPVNGTAIHLASYREIGSAKRGWQILSKSYKELVPLKPLYVAVDLPGKGHILRLYGTGSDATSLKTICREMHEDGAYCASNIAF
jgi:hypothetical protein